jgi:pimeloyl-ACP methyl ester carboxylesterase
VLFLLIGLFGAYIVACWYLAKMYLSPPRERVPSMAAYTRVTDIINPPNWASPHLVAGKQTGDTLYVMVHGYRGTVAHWKEIGEDLMAKHKDVVLIEMPGHGDSPEDACGFGPKESDAVVTATKWALSRYHKRPKVVLVGVSMGGAAAWLATEKHPELFDAICTEGAYAKLDEAIDGWFDNRLAGGRYSLYPVKAFACRMSGIDPSKINPVEAAKHWRGKPALIVHCENDALMGESHAKRLAEASGGDLWVIENAEHAQGAGDARAEYVTCLLQLAK